MKYGHEQFQAMLSGGKYCWTLQIGMNSGFPDLLGDLQDSKSTSGGILCIFWSRTFAPICWMCRSLTQPYTESEEISFDAGLRTDGAPALDLWDLVIEVLHSSPKSDKARRD